MFPKFITKEEQLPQDIRQSISNMPIRERILYLSQWMATTSRSKPKYMFYMVMYDIENNKIRTNIAKYLIRKGCMRIQKSIYIAKGSSKEMNEISNTLKEINEAYDNLDSIFVLPIPQEKFNNMKIIGKNITFELITQPKNVLIF